MQAPLVGRAFFDSVMKIEQIAVDKLIPYARNPRKNEAAIAGVAASIKEFGFKQPVVIDKGGVIVVGHTRVKAAQKLGLETVPCLRADDLTPQQIKAYRILDNKVAEKSEWDTELLELELGEIELDLAPFEVEFAGLAGEAVDNALAEWQDMPEFENTPKAFRSLLVHFKDASAVDEFQQLISQDILETAKYIWHPEQKRRDLKNINWDSDE